MIGDRDTHRINIKGKQDPYPKMGKILCDQKENYGMSLKEIQIKLVGQGWKIRLYSALLIYWVMLLVATFLP